MLVGVLVVFTLFAGQLVRLQALDASAISRVGLETRLDTVVIPAVRGDITDVNGVVLARTNERRNVTADQLAVPYYTKNGEQVGVAGAAADLSPWLGMTTEQLTAILTGKARFVYVAKDISPLSWRGIAALQIPGIFSERDTERIYPAGSTTSALVGFVGPNGQTQQENPDKNSTAKGPVVGGGVELRYNEQLKGENGTQTYEGSPDGKIIPSGDTQYTPAVPGLDLRLTIDNDVQFFAQNALAKQVMKTNALSGSVVVQNVKTGQLVAVATYPTFDPVKRPKGANLNNPAFTDAYEPGSTAKVMTAAAALEEGVATPSSVFTVPNRIKRADDKTFKDSHDHPTEKLTMAGVIAQSSNIGTILMGEKMRRVQLYKYFTAFGMGQFTKIGFPGETQGIYPEPATWNDSQYYTMMFGQGLSVNAVQAAGVFQTIANGGVRIAPTLVAGTTGADGVFTPATLPEGTRVMSAANATKLSQMLEFVVGDEGTAKEARVSGYRVAGKTGTADRVVNGKYDGKTASFIGYAPADKPEYVVAVTIQDPTIGYYGGSTAGPVFKDVMTYVLQKYGVSPTGTEPPKLELRAGEGPVSAGAVQKVTKSSGR